MEQSRSEATMLAEEESTTKTQEAVAGIPALIENPFFNF
jgi:hypothetical protein